MATHRSAKGGESSRYSDRIDTVDMDINSDENASNDTSEWFISFKWLNYCVTRNKIFCFYC